MRMRSALTGGLAAVLAVASLASALPVELKDSNGSKYQVNTQVVPLSALSNASGALTNATFVKSVTVTYYYIGFTPWFGFLTTYTTQHQVNVPLTPAFGDHDVNPPTGGFNSFLITAVNGQKLPAPFVFNPGQALAGQDCPDSNGRNKQLDFANQTFSEQNLTLTRKVYVPSNQEWARWLNIVTNTGSASTPVTIALLGLIGSGNATRVVTTSSGDNILTIGDLWFTTQQNVQNSLQPTIGYVVQGPGATVPVSNLGISTTSSPPGKAAFSYTATLAPAGSPGSTAIVMTFVTVQGKSNAAKNTCNDIVTNPLPASAIKCISEQELSQIVNFEHITPPMLKNATVKLKFNKTNQDTAQWKGKITIGAGINLSGLPVTVNLGGVMQSFTLKKGGSANNGDGNKFNLAAELKNGVTKAGTYNFSFNLKGDLQTAFAQYGLTNANASNVAVSIPLTMTAGPGEYAVDQPFTYNATAGKSGTAKTS
ncbi:MAG: hypothetical protein E6J71_24655 [Deltaproteobacteria bacterium]|nr:MAG: hypothetical protein E6J71_24655 [Deltaproteobacteria bacterium]